ncbi:MAG: gliding motility-associated C-terminal domain-containing protein [Saprospiraceae bacterium]|nr:gliding motility-associated C-terminal domain-containing protein [Saprospiraceae bacterium]MDW8231075.1 gliding motility-associated C-terminal domain-containing protein [Saprospiraceae bacterium]
MAQPRFLSLFPQADVDTRIHPSHVRSLNDGRILTATLLASEQGVELLHWDACGYNLQRRRLTLSPVRRVVGFEASENASTTLALQTDSLTLALIRIQPDGSIAWARHYRTSSPITWTSFDGDEKHFVVGGYAPGLARVLAIKLDSGGGLLWSRAAAQAGNAGQVCLTPQGRVFQIVSDRKALLWSESGNVLWMAHVGGLHFGMINLKPTVLSDGYAVAVRRLFNYLHVVKLTEDGQLAWFTQALPVDIFTTSTQLFNTGIKRLLPFGKDSVLVLANFGLSAADGGYVSIHLVGPNGQLLRRNFIQPGGGFRAQDVAASGRHVAVSGLGSANSGNGLMQLTKALTLGCGDFQQPALTDPTITVEVTLDSLPPVSNWPLMVSNLATQIQTLSPYSPTFYCQTNDTAATDLVHRRPTCLGEVVYLRPEAPEGAVITWADGRRDTVFRAEGPGTYSAQIAYCGLNWRVEYSLEARDCACEPIYPTAFTPDGDGVNDAFGPIAVPECAYAAFEWAVFNRWGERLFASSSPADAWNGRRPDGQAAPSDVYVWQLRYALPNGSERAWFVKKGDVTLMR